MEDKLSTFEDVNQLIDKYNEFSDRFNENFDEYNEFSDNLKEDWETAFFMMLKINESNNKRVGEIMNVLFDNLDYLPEVVLEVMQKYSNLERNNLKGK